MQITPMLWCIRLVETCSYCVRIENYKKNRERHRCGAILLKYR